MKQTTKNLLVFSFIVVAPLFSAGFSAGAVFDPAGFAHVPSSTVANLGTPAIGTLRIVTDGSNSTDCISGGGSSIVYCWYNGTDWVTVGAGGAEADTLDTVFDRGKIIDGANSVANAVRIGDGTTPICLYTDATLGPQVRPCTDADVKTIIPTNFTWCLYDIEGTSCVLTVDPDAASANAMWTLASPYRWRKSVWLGAGAASTDATQCAAPTESSNTLVKTWTIVCADHDSGAIYWTLVMPDSWDGGTITLEWDIHQVAASTNTVEMDFAAMCYSHDEAISAFASPPTGEQAASITLTADNDTLHATTAAITVAGSTCAGGDTLFVTGQVDATASHADIATAVETLGAKLEYTVSSLSD
jgi:hypothetical protein